MTILHVCRAGLLLIPLCLANRPTEAQGPEVTTLAAKNLAAGGRKEALMLMVEYRPGESEPVHRHDAQAFVYVLEGSVVMQVKGKPPVTLAPGQTFYEGNDDVHLVGRNASGTSRARFLVFLVKEKDAALAVPAQ
jgi:quercetin dioxygenase-like cupin family protein